MIQAHKDYENKSQSINNFNSSLRLMRTKNEWQRLLDIIDMIKFWLVKNHKNLI